MEKCIEQSFLQSPEWERFQQSLGNETFRAGGSLFVIHELPIVGRYAYCPRGPRVEIQNVKYQMSNVLEEAKRHKCAWIRIEPNSEEELKGISDFLVTRNLSLATCHRDVQPREILVMDIRKSEEQLLAEMKPKIRYNIRLAQKKGVQIVVSKEREHRDRFFELVQETSLRAGIRSHAREHYEKMLDALGDTAQLYNAVYQDKVIATNLMIFYEDAAIYLHGGSSNEHRNVMAPFLLQWRAMQDAQQKGCKWYDFGGVATNNQQSTTNDAEKNVKCLEWKGITNFKQGFCPNTEPVYFSGTYDVVLSLWRYRMYRTLVRIKKFRKK